VLGAIVSVGLVAGPLLAQEGLPTLDEAFGISKKTGRPILVMAGQKT
jgi:hypothetical protein